MFRRIMRGQWDFSVRRARLRCAVVRSSRLGHPGAHLEDHQRERQGSHPQAHVSESRTTADGITGSGALLGQGVAAAKPVFVMVDVLNRVCAGKQRAGCPPDVNHREHSRVQCTSQAQGRHACCQGSRPSHAGHAGRISVQPSGRCKCWECGKRPECKRRCRTRQPGACPAGRGSRREACKSCGSCSGGWWRRGPPLAEPVSCRSKLCFTWRLTCVHANLCLLSARAE
jgi:hypothetical protein